MVISCFQGILTCKTTTVNRVEPTKGWIRLLRECKCRQRQICNELFTHNYYEPFLWPINKSHKRVIYKSWTNLSKLTKKRGIRHLEAHFCAIFRSFGRNGGIIFTQALHDSINTPRSCQNYETESGSSRFFGQFLFMTHTIMRLYRVLGERCAKLWIEI